MDLCVLKAIVGYKRSKQKHIHLVVAYTFNPSTRDLHILNPSTRGKYKMGGDRELGFNLQLPNLGEGKSSLVA